MACSVFSNPTISSHIPRQCGSLKRSRPTDIVTTNKRLCVADFDSESCSSANEDNATTGKAVKLGRSLSAVAQATLISPPSPPVSSPGGMTHGYPGAFSSDPEAAGCCHGNDDSHVMPSQARCSRNKSISVAALHKRRTVTNPKNIINRKRRQPCVPRSDLSARARCFDYLVSAIDEAWAQYCTYTSTAEDELYNCEEEGSKLNAPTTTNNHHTAYHDMPTSPVSLCEDDAYYSSDAESYGPRTPYNYSHGTSSPKHSMNMYNNRRTSIMGASVSHIKHDDEDDCDYDEEYNDDDHPKPTVSNKALAPSEQPGSVRLLNLKTRLMNVKYYLQDLVDADDFESSSFFWNRWDLIKYSAIELVEEDGDDDEIVETTTAKLEHGRYYAMTY